MGVFHDTMQAPTGLTPLPAEGTAPASGLDQSRRLRARQKAVLGASRCLGILTNDLAALVYAQSRRGKRPRYVNRGKTVILE